MEPPRKLLEGHASPLDQLLTEEQLWQKEEAVDLLSLARLLLAGPQLRLKESELYDQLAAAWPLALPEPPQLEAELHHHQAQLGEEVALPEV